MEIVDNLSQGFSRMATFCGDAKSYLHDLVKILTQRYTLNVCRDILAGLTDTYHYKFAGKSYMIMYKSYLIIHSPVRALTSPVALAYRYIRRTSLRLCGVMSPMRMACPSSVVWRPGCGMPGSSEGVREV